jgi:hypothetical protein
MSDIPGSSAGGSQSGPLKEYVASCAVLKEKELTTLFVDFHDLLEFDGVF